MKIETWTKKGEDEYVHETEARGMGDACCEDLNLPHPPRPASISHTSFAIPMGPLVKNKETLLISYA